MSSAKLLFIDAYDSFSASITALLQQLSQVEVVTIKIDSDIADLYGIPNDAFLSHFDAIVLGPGPGHPGNDKDVGLFNDVWRIAETQQIPVLGICLGFQHLCLRYGLPVKRMPMPCHGHVRLIQHRGEDIFQNIGEVCATQYNSLGVSVKHWNAILQGRPESMDTAMNQSPDASRPPSIFSSEDESDCGLDDSNEANQMQLLAWNEDNYAMAVRHRSLPFWGVQFHPESCKSSLSCHQMLQNWLKHTSPLRAGKQKSQIPALISVLECATPNTPQVDTVVKSLEQSIPHTATHVDFEILNLSGNKHKIRDFCYKLSNTSDMIMLESTAKGRYSIYGLPDTTTTRLEVSNSTCTVFKAERRQCVHSIGANDTLKVLEKLLLQRQITKGPKDVPFWGGFAGYLSYECGLRFVGAGSEAQLASDSQVPDISLIWVDRSIVVDLEAGTLFVQTVRINDERWLQQTIVSLQELYYQSQVVIDKSALAQAMVRLPSREEYLRKVHACQSELMAGNSYELCLTTEAIVRTPVGAHYPFEIYKNLQIHNPAPYAGFLRVGKIIILCSSPERFLSWSRSGVLDMIPMKGTVKKAPNMTVEKATAILASPKESAENLMIADLIRHDLCNVVGHKDSKVETIKLCDVIEHETVYQLVSHIRASKNPIVRSLSYSTEQAIQTGVRALQYTLPPGSMTGAPKKRSCEILSSLEQRTRRVYSGVIGYFDIGGGGAWNVCIRSAFSLASEDQDGMHTWHIGAGGAVTVLSNPEDEWEEMQTKLGSVLKAFGRH